MFAGGLLIAAAALAAFRVIGASSPEEGHGVSRAMSARTGIGVPAGGTRRPYAFAYLLPISTPDPAGGLPWGMQVVQTPGKEVCLQVGRLRGGRLGVVGQDGAFANDGRFHELPAGVLDPQTCSGPLDSALYHSEGLPASGAMPGPSPSCLYPGVAWRTSDPNPCPSADERTIAFGILGPHARNVSYQLNGARHAVRTTALYGAYLIVLPQPATRQVPLKADVRSGQRSLATHLHRYPTLATVSFPLDSFPIKTRSSLITNAQFEFRYTDCQSGSAPDAAGPPTCTNRLGGGPLSVQPRG